MRKTILLALIFFGFTVNPAKAALQTVFSDSFESDLSAWQTQISAGCTLQVQQPPPDRISPDGGKQIFLFQSVSGSPDCYLTRRITPTLTQGKISLWFFDNVDAANRLETIAAIKDNSNHAIWLGVRTSLNPNSYTLRVDSDELDSGVSRTFGWHKFEFYVSGDQSFAAIDGVALRAKGFSGLLRNIDEFKISAGWGAIGATRIDGVKIEQSDIPLAEAISLSPNNASGSQQTFTTRIKSTTGVNYFDNIFIQLGETAPEEANSDMTLLYSLRKDAQGQMRFYGPRWLGTVPNISSPNIGYKDSYAYDVGGFVGGEARLICTNTSRQSSLSQTAASIGCLDLSQSSSSWDNSTKELVVNWKVIFLPNFINIRSTRRFFPVPSLALRPINVYLSVDNPLSYMSQPQAYYTRYNWNQVGAYTVGTSLNHSTISPTTGTSNRRTFSTVISHPSDANQISEAYLWLDEYQPTAQRSDVAVSFGVKKDNATYKFYGRDYLGANTTCANDPFPYLGPDCYLNYDYSVGGSSPGTSSSLYYNLNRKTTLQPGIRSTASLHISSSRITVNPNNPRQLIIDWDIEFLPYIGPRSFNTYVRWTGTSGTLGNWQKVGVYNTGFTVPDHGAIGVSPDNRHLQFADGTPYSWIGYNRYFLDRFYSQSEIDGEFAKMRLYGMNFARLWVLSRNPVVEMMRSMSQMAKKQGIYIDLMIFNDPFSDIVHEAAPRTASKDWAYYMINQISRMDNVFMIDVFNDFNPRALPSERAWGLDVIPYIESINYQHKLLTFQPTGDVPIDDPAYDQLRNLIDTYSIRGYDTDPNRLASTLNSQYQRALAASPAKPIYVGEGRWWSSDSTFVPNWQELYQPTFDSTTDVLLKEAKRLGLPGVVLWTQDFRAEYSQLPGPIWPNLSPQEYNSFLQLSFPPQPGDINGDYRIDVNDLKLIITNWFGGSNCSNFDCDLNNDSKINSLDAATVLVNFGM